MNFKDQTVFVTGASSGLGKAFCDELAAQGAHVILCARRADILEKTQSALQKSYPQQKFSVSPIDIQNRHSVYQGVSKILETQTVDILINCAGITACDYIDRTSDEKFESILHTNFLGMVWMTKALLPHFKERKKGKILNISSIAGGIGFTGYAAYTPSKYAVCGFSEVIRHELKPHNIQVCVSLPGDLNTPQLELENQTKPEATKKIAGKVKIMEPTMAAQIILKKFLKNRFYILCDFNGVISFYLPRLFPSLSRLILDIIGK